MVTATASATTTATVTAPPTGALAVFLDAEGFTPEAGADRLTPLPRAVRGDAGCADHPIAVSCPSHQTGDEASDVTLPLGVAVDEAENLTVRVQCDDPRGTVVLTGARLTPR